MLPEPDLGPAIESLAAKSPTRCDPTVKPGVAIFSEFVMGRLGGRDLGITRRDGCAAATSQHHEGRAWDWGVLADKPEEKAAADTLIDWLLKTDQYGNEFANFRRAGLRYMIWDRRIWSTGTAVGFALRTTRSARFPTLMLPFTDSSNWA